MSNWKIDSPDKVQPEDVRYLLDRLQAFNDAHVQEPFARKEIRLFVRDADAKLIGGLIGSISMHCLVIQILWVDDSCRHKGMGSELVREAERLAIEAGAIQCILETTDFQAPDFYVSLDYVPIFEVPDAPKGGKTIFLRKVF